MNGKLKNLLLVRRPVLILLTMSLVSLAAAYGTMLWLNRERPAMAGAVTQASAAPVVVIDAGHGGMDGGAVGVHREVEKEINLAIAKNLNIMLKAGGFETVMVREEDVSIHDPRFTSVKQQKTSDIKNRLKLAEETPGAIYLSIHMNHFDQKKYSGAQMFYSPNNPESALLATQLQQQFRELLQPENERETKPAGKNLYILSRATCPAVLVECGFLSNPEESVRLADPDYQRQVAFTIYTAVLKYHETDGMPPSSGV